MSVPKQWLLINDTVTDFGVTSGLTFATSVYLSSFISEYNIAAGTGFKYNKCPFTIRSHLTTLSNIISFRTTNRDNFNFRKTKKMKMIALISSYELRGAESALH